MLRLKFLTILLLLVSCQSMGIKLSETKTNPLLNSCTKQSEVRAYKVLFMLPFRESQITELSTESSDSIQSITEYAKPWDIGFTTLGFLFSLTSSTKQITFCNEAEMKKILPPEKLSISLPHYSRLGAAQPALQILFAKDDSQLSESERLKLLPIVQTLLASGETFQIVLVGKTNTSGDIAYQTRLTSRRAEEIKSVLLSASFDAERINVLFTDKDLGGSDSVSTISIFLVKE